jgi:hypothetical protein
MLLPKLQQIRICGCVAHNKHLTGHREGACMAARLRSYARVEVGARAMISLSHWFLF